MKKNETGIKGKVLTKNTSGFNGIKRSTRKPIWEKKKKFDIRDLKNREIANAAQMNQNFDMIFGKKKKEKIKLPKNWGKIGLSSKCPLCGK